MGAIMTVSGELPKPKVEVTAEPVPGSSMTKNALVVRGPSANDMPEKAGSSKKVENEKKEKINKLVGTTDLALLAAAGLVSFFREQPK